MDILKENLNNLYEQEVYDKDANKLGKVENIYLDDQTEKVTWISIKTGFFGTKHTIVPIEAVQELDNKLVLPYDKEFVKNAPHLDAEKHLSPEDEQELYHYYNVNGYATSTTTDNTTNNYTETHIENDRKEFSANDAIVNGDNRTDEVTNSKELYEDHHAETDNDNNEEITLHAERVNFGTESVETGEARLHKYVVTEEQSVDVPVTREEAHIVREPLNERVEGHQLGEEEISIKLHEEAPIIEKETIATERVSLDTNTVETNETVTVQTAHEEIEVVEDNNSTHDVENNTHASHDNKIENN